MRLSRADHIFDWMFFFLLLFFVRYKLLEWFIKNVCICYEMVWKSNGEYVHKIDSIFFFAFYLRHNFTFFLVIYSLDAIDHRNEMISIAKKKKNWKNWYEVLFSTSRAFPSLASLKQNMCVLIHNQAIECIQLNVFKWSERKFIKT